MKPYHATPDELCAIDEGLDHCAPFIPAEKLPEFWRAEAARLRREADQTETVETRIILLEGVDRFNRMAEARQKLRP